MGWTPTRSGGTGSADGTATPPPARRRRRPAAETSTPKVDAQVAANPRPSTNTRPRGGVNIANEPQRGEDPRGRSIKIRPGKRWSEIIGAVKAGEYTWAQFVEGLDDEELARGQLRDMNGGFMGRPPAMVPREFVLACQRDLKRRFEEIFSGEVLGIARKYVALAQSPTLKEETRAKMMQYAMERIFGGIPKDVRVSQEQPWEQLVVNVMREAGEDMPDHLVERYARYGERKGNGTEPE